MVVMWIKVFVIKNPASADAGPLLPGSPGGGEPAPPGGENGLPGGLGRRNGMVDLRVPTNTVAALPG